METIALIAPDAASLARARELAEEIARSLARFEHGRGIGLGAARLLVQALRRNGIEARLVGGACGGITPHYWVETLGYVLDPTRRQFGPGPLAEALPSPLHLEDAMLTAEAQRPELGPLGDVGERPAAAQGDGRRAVLPAAAFGGLAG